MMHDTVIDSCETGVSIVRPNDRLPATSPSNSTSLSVPSAVPIFFRNFTAPGNSSSEGRGSFMLIDALISDTQTAVSAALAGDSSTSLLLQNIVFNNVGVGVKNSITKSTALPGGSQHVDSWGYGSVVDASGTRSFNAGSTLPAPLRNETLLSNSTYGSKNFFLRPRPQYADLGHSQVLDVKAFGAKGDGQTDDGPVLNAIFEIAANLSSIVYIPYGVYLIKDTVNVPINSRIIGQAWPQIMASGPKFENVSSPRIAVKVGEVGDVGVLEIQNMLFTASGPTAGVVLLEWNVRESTPGSAGMWGKPEQLFYFLFVLF